MSVNARAALLCLALALAPPARASDAPPAQPIYELNDEEYYAMPRLFELDEYAPCLAQRGLFCVGSFELTAPDNNHLYQTMKGWSADWVDNYNHTRLHRALCVSRRCSRPPAMRAARPSAWFEWCVNETTTSAYNISAQLYRLEYCRRGPPETPPLSMAQRAFAAAFATLLALTAIGTCLEFTLTDRAKKKAGCALAWSLQRSWRALTAPTPRNTGADLRTLDGLRVFCMMSVILEHVCWLATQSYISDTRTMERIRKQPDVVLMTNSTLVVQIFFIMSSFLLAHKLLQRREPAPLCRTFLDTMLNRIVRISPSHFIVIWFAASWWERLGDGPLWAPLVGAEAGVCRRKWWTHLLYLNNLVYPDDKCLIPTWYLAADMQLYAVALLLTLLLRGRRAAVPLLGALFALVTGLNFTFAYLWQLVPNFVIHRPESVRVAYGGEMSFNVLYQSPLGNAPAMLAGLLLAHAHHALRHDTRLADNKTFRWISISAAPAATCWAALSPLLVGEGPPRRLAAAALAALERPMFALFVMAALLGAINGVKSPWRTWLSHMGGVVPRLSFGALLLHLPLNKALVATRISPIQLDRPHAIYQWFGVGVISYAAAVPLALLVELPAQALFRDLHRRRAPSPPALDATQEKLDKTEK